MLRNTVNGKQYVGSAVNLKRREEEHFRGLRLGNHINKKLLHSWNKYGPAAFEFKPLLFCARENVLFYEQRAIDVLKPVFNLCKIAGSTLGIPCTPETKEKISAANRGKKLTPEHREKVRLSLIGNRRMCGKKLTAEHRANIGRGALGKKHSEEWKANIAAGRTGKKHSPATREKMGAAIRAAWARRKALAVQANSL